MCCSGVRAFLRSGMYTSWTNMDPQECMYVSWQVKEKNRKMVASSPFMPMGRKCAIATGTRICPCTDSFGIFARVSLTTRAVSANSGSRVTVSAASASSTVISVCGIQRQTRMMPAIFCSCGVRAELLKPDVPCQDM